MVGIDILCGDAVGVGYVWIIAIPDPPRDVLKWEGEYSGSCEDVSFSASSIDVERRGIEKLNLREWGLLRA